MGLSSPPIRPGKCRSEKEEKKWKGIWPARPEIGMKTKIHESADP